MIPITPSEQQHYEDRLKFRQSSAAGNLWDLLDEVCDPEIPALSLWDLGVLADVEQVEDRIVVTITPTYSGCPAMDVMREDIIKVLNTGGYSNVEVKTQLSPAWSSNWLSPQGREKMQQFGIAPPNRSYCQKIQQSLQPDTGINCPICGSTNTRQVSEFGSTSCKALHQCQDCLEPFDYFKSI